MGALPFFLGMLWRRDEMRVNLKPGIWFAAIFAVLMIFEAFYNAERLGSPFDNGYKRVLTGAYMPWECSA
jgi:hypothetical protein